MYTLSLLFNPNTSLTNLTEYIRKYQKKTSLFIEKIKIPVEEILLAATRRNTWVWFLASRIPITILIIMKNPRSINHW